MDSDQLLLREAYTHAAGASQHKVTQSGAVLVHDIFSDIKALGADKYHGDIHLHAPLVAILEAARHGIHTYKATLYCPAGICYECAPLLVECKIGVVVVHTEHPHYIADKTGIVILQKHLIEVREFSGKIGECQILLHGEPWHP